MKLNINGLIWKLSFVKKEDIDGCYGITKFSTLEIKIATNLHRDVVRTTITHELIHAYLESLGYTVPNVDSSMLFSEEQVCDFIAMNLDAITKQASKIFLVYLGKYMYNKDEVNK